MKKNDYYPFGMLMPGRRSNGGNYRYGFNGKENDNDVKGEGNQQDYGMRVYDTRLGRFLSVDPLTKSYPHYTPYSYAGNKPIQFIDLDGGEEKKHWWQYDFRDLMEWGRAPTNPLKDDGFAHSLATDINRNFNPIYNATVLVAGEENLGIPSFYDPMSRGDAAFNLTTQWMFLKYSKIASTSNAQVQMEKQMASNAKALKSTNSKPPQEKPALNLSNEEKQKIIAWVKQESSTGAHISTPSITAKMTTPQTGFEFFRTASEISEGLLKARGKGLKGTYDFVVTNDGKLILGKGHYHLSGGSGSVKAAGQIQLWEGKVKNINNASGHYQPTAEETRNFGEIFKNLGVNVSETSLNIYTPGSRVAEKIKL